MLLSNILILLMALFMIGVLAADAIILDKCEVTPAPESVKTDVNHLEYVNYIFGSLFVLVAFVFSVLVKHRGSDYNLLQVKGFRSDRGSGGSVPGRAMAFFDVSMLAGCIFSAILLIVNGVFLTACAHDQGSWHGVKIADWIFVGLLSLVVLGTCGAMALKGKLKKSNSKK